MMMGRSKETMRKLVWMLVALQGVVAILFFLIIRYHDDHVHRHQGHEEHVQEAQQAVEKYPWMLDVHVMLYGGFGFLMTFLRRFGFSALGLTMLLITVSTEVAVLVAAMLRVDGDFVAFIDLFDVLEGGLASAAVLISFGAVLGKLTMLQLVSMAILESTVFVINGYIGYKLLGALDVGGAIFVHVFGSFYGLAVSFAHRHVAVDVAEEVHGGSNYVSDITAMIGTILLFVFWPSFNAILAADPILAERAILNSYFSLLASVAATFIVSIIDQPEHMLSMVDIQNATLAGGVAVGAVADLLTRPFEALLCGSVVGSISVLGYHRLQSKLLRSLGIHDTCGVNNLHGMPGVISGLISILAVGMAEVELYGPQMYYKLFPLAAPEVDSDAFEMLKASLDVQPGESRTQGNQAIIQMVALLLTIFVAIITGFLTGVVLRVQSLFHPLDNTQMFNDANFWSMANEESIPKKSINSNREEGHGQNFSELNTNHIARNAIGPSSSPAPSRDSSL